MEEKGFKSAPETWKCQRRHDSSQFEKKPHTHTCILFNTDFKGRPRGIIGAKFFIGPINPVAPISKTVALKAEQSRRIVHDKITSKLVSAK